MYRFNKKKDNRFLPHHQEQPQTPSFSSTLLDNIYRSIDNDHNTISFYTEPTTTTSAKKQSTKATAMNATDKFRVQWNASRHRGNTNRDAAFFSSTTSSSSESSSGGLSSSSDTESMYGPSSSCFAPSSRPRPVRTSLPLPAPQKPDNSTRRHTHTLPVQNASHSYNNIAIETNEEEGLIKSKSRALKIYNNLKKVKQQPISPKLTNFLNSLFTKTNATADRKSKPGPQISSSTTCSSASSFARSCLTNNSPSTRDKLRTSKRTVRFYPVSVIVDEESRPCGHKSLYEEEEGTERVMSACKIGRPPLTKKKREQELKFPVMADKSEEEDDDDVASCSSSDLFELDHLAVMGDNTSSRYCEELPVYETTHRFGRYYTN